MKEEIRSLTYKESKELYEQLIRMGYPAQIIYVSDKWKVIVEGMFTTTETKKITYS